VSAPLTDETAARLAAALERLASLIEQAAEDEWTVEIPGVVIPKGQRGA
jgi:hypothetical protein